MGITRESILKKALEMADHNLYCCSENVLMTKPTPGKEAEHAGYAAEGDIIRAWLAEVTPEARFERDLRDARDGHGDIEIITDRREEIARLQRELAQIEEAAG